MRRNYHEKTRKERTRGKAAYRHQVRANYARYRKVREEHDLKAMSFVEFVSETKAVLQERREEEELKGVERRAAQIRRAEQLLETTEVITPEHPDYLEIQQLAKEQKNEIVEI